MRAKLFLLLLLFLFCGPGTAVAQPHGHAMHSGSLPQDIQDLLKRSDKDLLKSENGSEATAPFFVRTNMSVKNMLGSSRLMYGDTLTAYLRRVAGRVMAGSPAISVRPRFYVLCNAIPNAMSFADGSIFFTTGLLARLNSESQLAFIIGHEISHYQKKHALHEFEKGQALQEQFSSTDNMGNYIRIMQYSKENELEADGAGLEYLMNAGYNPAEAVKALIALDQNDTLRYNTPINLKMHFENEIFSIDSIKAQDAYKTSIVIHSASDQLETHPALDKRIIAVKEILKYSPGAAKPLPGDSARYAPCQQLAETGLPEDALEAGWYGESLYLALQLLDKRPGEEVAYLHYIVAKNLFWLAEYAERKELRMALKHKSTVYGKAYENLTDFLEELSPNDHKKMAYGYVSDNSKKHPKSEELSFYTAYLADHYLGAGVSRYYFNAYLKSYPAGKYASYAKTKLN